MPTIEFDLTDLQAMKLAVYCGWQVSDLSGEAKKIVLETIQKAQASSSKPRRPTPPKVNEPMPMATNGTGADER